MAGKVFSYTIKLNVKDGRIQVDKLDSQLKQLRTTIHEVNEEGKNLNTALGQTASKAGLAGAAVVEIGRTISDANYGMMAMANNIQQVATLFITLTATSGGLTAGLKEMWKAFMGPLGLIVVFQAAIAWLEKIDREAKRTAETVDKVAEAYENAAVALEVQLEKDLTLTKQEAESIKARIQNLKDEAKVRAQIAEIMQIQSDLLKLDNADATLSWWAKMKVRFQNFDVTDLFRGRAPVGGAGDKEAVINEILGLQQWNVLEQKAALEQRIQDIIGDIDIDALLRTMPEDTEEDKTRAITSFGLGLNILENNNEILNSEFELAQLYASFHAARMQQIADEQEAEDTALRHARERKKNIANDIAYKKKLREEEAAHFLALNRAIGDSISNLGFVMGKQTAFGKALAVAGALIDSFAAGAAILKAAGKGPQGGIPGFAIAQAVAAVTFGLAQVKQILSVKVPASGGGSSGGGTGGVPSVTPQFNIIGASGPNRVGEAVRGALGDKPMRAYVTTKDIRSGQELDRNTRSGASL